MAATLGPIFYPGNNSGIVAMLRILVIDVLGVVLARYYFQRTSLAQTAQQKVRSAKRTKRKPADRETDAVVESDQPSNEVTVPALSLTQSVVHAAGMGFGVSGLIVFWYLASY